MTKFNRSAVSAVALLACAGAASAQPINTTFFFDDMPSQTPANNFTQPAGLGLNYSFGVFLPDLDADGLPIPGTDHWRPDLSAPPVLADNPARFGRGAAPSPVNAVESLFQPTLLTFDNAFSFGLAGFSTTLDNDTFGTNGLLPGNEDISVQFYDANNLLLARIPVDQTAPGFIAAGGAGLQNVKYILLPGGAFYDNIQIVGDVVPSPSAAGLLAGLLLLNRRRR